MINEEHPTKDTYRLEAIERLKTMIDKQGGLWEGDMCPECDSPFVRILLYMEYMPLSKEMQGKYLYILKCSGCGLAVRDIWETKEVWEITAVTEPK